MMFRSYMERNVFSPTLSGVFSPLHLLEGKAVVPVQHITCVTPYRNHFNSQHHKDTNLENDEQVKQRTSNMDGSRSSGFLVSPLTTYKQGLNLL